jgi:hypothetical protein
MEGEGVEGPINVEGEQKMWGWWMDRTRSTQSSFKISNNPRSVKKAGRETGRAEMAKKLAKELAKELAEKLRPTRDIKSNNSWSRGGWTP